VLAHLLHECEAHSNAPRCPIIGAIATAHVIRPLLPRAGDCEPSHRRRRRCSPRR
jgi:hypothetical protein